MSRELQQTIAYVESVMKAHKTLGNQIFIDTGITTYSVPCFEFGIREAVSCVRDYCDIGLVCHDEDEIRDIIADSFNARYAALVTSDYDYMPFWELFVDGVLHQLDARIVINEHGNDIVIKNDEK
ncbi:hypothetical protein [Photobacterium damselae]|uniref:hypothetical protein n=1 Tax=Photobacterium damselae TaxID=38293 RepID=UPI00165D4424|nr:hypothetical protein [Photobacterium damselae]